jgi:hypothetical protein
MQWLLILAASGYCIVSCISGAAAAQTLSEGRKKELREIIERETEKDTVKWVNKFLADANARGTDGNKEELGRAIQGVKNIISLEWKGCPYRKPKTADRGRESVEPHPQEPVEG